MTLQALLDGLSATEDQGCAAAYVTDHIRPLFAPTPMTKHARRQWMWQVVAQILTRELVLGIPLELREAHVGGFISACQQASDAMDAGDPVSPLEEAEMWLAVSADFTDCMNHQLAIHLQQGPPEI